MTCNTFNVIYINAAFVICNISGKLNVGLRTVLMNIDPPILNPSGSYIQTSVSEHFLCNSHSVSHMLLIPIETLRYERDCLRKPCVRRTSFITPKPSSLWEWTNVTNNNQCVIFIFFPVYFSEQPHLTTSYHVTFVYYSSIYSVYSWFFLINLMKTIVLASRNIVYLSLFHVVSSVFALVFFTLILNLRQKLSLVTTQSKYVFKLGW